MLAATTFSPQPHPLADADNLSCKLAKASLPGEGQGEGALLLATADPPAGHYEIPIVARHPPYLLFYAKQPSFQAHSRPRCAEMAAPGEQLPARGIEMTDVLMLAMGLAFFGIALAYVTACERL